MKDIKVGNVIFGKDNLGIIAGPCVIENRDHSLEMSYAIKEVSEDVGIPIIFKSSFDKACLLYTSPSPRDVEESRMPSSA